MMAARCSAGGTACSPPRRPKPKSSSFRNSRYRCAPWIITKQGDRSWLSTFCRAATSLATASRPGPRSARSIMRTRMRQHARDAGQKPGVGIVVRRSIEHEELDRVGPILRARLTSADERYGQGRLFLLADHQQIVPANGPEHGRGWVLDRDRVAQPGQPDADLLVQPGSTRAAFDSGTLFVDDRRDVSFEHQRRRSARSPSASARLRISARICSRRSSSSQTTWKRSFPSTSPF